MNTLYTTNLEVSKRIAELIGEQESEFYHYESNHSIMQSDVGKKFWYIAHKDNSSMRNCPRFPAFTLSELPPILKQCGKKLGWVQDDKMSFGVNGVDVYIPIHEFWTDVFTRVCQLISLGKTEKCDAYLLDILK